MNRNSQTYMHKLILTNVLLCAAISLAAGNVITYTSAKKLPTKSNAYKDGLFAQMFNTAIQSHKFRSGQGTITFDDAVTQIGEHAFSGCSTMTTITLPNSIKSIENSAFQQCSGLTTMVIPNGVNKIGWFAFKGCTSLTEVIISKTVTNIGGWAFSGCDQLQKVTLSNSVTEIGEKVFYSCPSLQVIWVPNRSLKRFKEMEGLKDYKDLIAGYDDSVELPQMRVGGSIREIVVKEKIKLVPSSSVLVTYKNDFGDYEMKEKDDEPFPYALFRIRLKGNIALAKENLRLYLGQLYKTVKIVTTYSNQILFLVPKGVRNVKVDCGDGCERQLIYEGQLEPNSIYEGILEIR